MSAPQRDRSNGLQRFGAALTMAAGALIATLCGGCALVVAAGFLAGSPRPSDWSFLIIPALIGGLPAVAGIVVFGYGLSRYRQAGRRNS